MPFKLLDNGFLDIPASDNPIAIACFGLENLRPFFDLNAVSQL